MTLAQLIDTAAANRPLLPTQNAGGSFWTHSTAGMLGAVATVIGAIGGIFAGRSNLLTKRAELAAKAEEQATAWVNDRVGKAMDQLLADRDRRITQLEEQNKGQAARIEVLEATLTEARILKHDKDGALSLKQIELVAAQEDVRRAVDAGAEQTRRIEGLKQTISETARQRDEAIVDARRARTEADRLRAELAAARAHPPKPEKPQ
jgi:uncharacterized coiled-coil protein SlyX